MSQEEPERPEKLSSDELNAHLFPGNGIRPLRKRRALKACDYCKWRKRKCFKPSPNSILCVQCILLKLTCSLETEFRHDYPNVKIVNGVPEHFAHLENASLNSLASMLQKIDLIYDSVAELLRLATEKNEPQDNVKLLLEAAQMKQKDLGPYGDSQPFVPMAETGETVGKDDASILIAQARSFRTSPLYLISNSADTPRELLNLFLTRPEEFLPDDVITKKILTRADTVALMDNFRSNYGRWVLFPIQISSSDLVENIRKVSSLLLTTCCCLSMRFSISSENPHSCSTFQAVVLHLISDLNTCILRYASFPGEQTGDIEYLQALVILAIYLTSLSSIASSANELLSSGRNVNFDAWYLSGLGLSTMISKSVFGKLLRSSHTSDTNLRSFLSEIGSEDIDSDQTLTIFRIYNHLVLVHLVGCVVSGRMCMVDEIRLNYCTSALSLPSATNFDGRMVSEIEILLITYNFVQVNLDVEDQLDLNYEAVGHEIRAWYEQWLYLFEQPTLQFVQLCYHFCNLQIFLTYLNCKSGAGLVDNLQAVISLADDDMLKLIFTHALELVKFAGKVEDDSYFGYLSDQIHFFFFYGCNCLLESVSLLTRRKASKKWKSTLEDVAEVVLKYERITQNNPLDVLSKYKEGILRRTRELFPEN